MKSGLSCYLCRVGLSLILMTAALSSAGQELRTAAQDSVPKYYTASDGSMQGLCIDILNALARTDPLLHFTGQDHFLPSGRIYRALRNGSLDLFCGSGKTRRRQTQVIYLEPPLYPVNHRLLARQEDPVQISSFQELSALGEAGLTLTYLNSATHHFLEQQEGLVLGSGTDLDNLFERLLLGRGRFIYYHDLGLNHYVRSHRLESRVRFLPTKFRTYNHYLVVSKHTPEAARERLHAALEKLVASGELKAIYKTYSPQEVDQAH